MLYSQMSPAQRAALFDEPSRYPFHVNFLGKYAVLTEVEITLLRQQGVDFDIDDAEATYVLGTGAVAVAATERELTTSFVWIGLAVLLSAFRAIVLSTWRLVRGR